jgi:prolyl oligopeptidase
MGALPVLFLASACPLFGAIPPAPVAPRVPVVDNYFGTSITDDYRWMEASENPELTRYLKAQNDRTRLVLDSIPGRAKLGARIRALGDAIAVTTRVERRGALLFYEKLTPGSNAPRLYVREGTRGRERILLDPAQFSKSDPHLAISYWMSSDDGAWIAVGLSSGGSENAVLNVLETSTGRALSETIDRTNFGVTAWRPDSKALYYLRLPLLPPGAPATAKYQNVMTYLHVLGTDPRQDRAVFGIGLSPTVPMEPDDDAVAIVDPSSPYALGLVAHGLQIDLTIYVAPRTELDGGHAHWTRVADVDAGITELACHGSQLFLLSHQDAPRFKVVESEAGRPDLAHARVVIAPSERVNQHLSAASDGLYVQSLEDGLGRITRVDWYGRRSEAPLPINGTISNLATDFNEAGFVARLEGWTVPPRWYSFDPATGATNDIGVDPPSPFNTTGIVCEETKVRAADGVLVPLSIVRPKSIKLDGTNPTLLYAYGAYGDNANPSFAAARLAWFEEGGIYAVAHVRGGGEYGEEWHLAGKGANKVKTVSDYIDCARWLISRGYTSPSKLGGRGGSAGGITVGGAIANAPELFAAVLDDVPESDLLRAELTATGPANIPEFGSVRTPEGFKILYATSPVHHLRPGGLYPAVMLTTGANDARVDPWQAAKMAATLQADSASGKPILLRVDYGGGHGLIGASKSQAADLVTDEFTFLLWNMGVAEFQP